jgi:hypothetical protein
VTSGVAGAACALICHRTAKTEMGTRGNRRAPARCCALTCQSCERVAEAEREPQKLKKGLPLSACLPELSSLGGFLVNGLVHPQPLPFQIQAFARQAEQLGGVLDAVVGELHRVLDHRAFEVLDRR